MTAFRNPDGSVAVVVLNTATTAQSATFALHATGGSRAMPYLTDASHAVAAQAAVSISHGSFTATVPPRSLVTYDIPAGS